MPDPWSAFFTVDTVAFLLASGFALSFVIISMRKSLKMPIYLILMNTLTVFSFFVFTGVATGYFAIPLIFGSAIIGVRWFNRSVLEQTYSGETKILMNYTVFIGIALPLLALANLSQLSGTIPHPVNPLCTFGSNVLDAFSGVINCISSVINSFSSYLGYFFGFSSPIQVINVIFIVPFIIFLLIFAINHLPFISGGK